MTRVDTPADIIYRMTEPRPHSATMNTNTAPIVPIVKRWPFLLWAGAGTQHTQHASGATAPFCGAGYTAQFTVGPFYFPRPQASAQFTTHQRWEMMAARHENSQHGRQSRAGSNTKPVSGAAATPNAARTAGKPNPISPTPTRPSVTAGQRCTHRPQ